MVTAEWFVTVKNRKTGDTTKKAQIKFIDGTGTDDIREVVKANVTNRLKWSIKEITEEEFYKFDEQDITDETPYGLKLKDKIFIRCSLSLSKKKVLSSFVIAFDREDKHRFAQITHEGNKRIKWGFTITRQENKEKEKWLS